MPHHLIVAVWRPVLVQACPTHVAGITGPGDWNVLFDIFKPFSSNLVCTPYYSFKFVYQLHIQVPPPGPQFVWRDRVTLGSNCIFGILKLSWFKCSLHNLLIYLSSYVNEMFRSGLQVLYLWKGTSRLWCPNAISAVCKPIWSKCSLYNLLIVLSQCLGPTSRSSSCGEGPHDYGLTVIFSIFKPTCSKFSVRIEIILLSSYVTDMFKLHCLVLQLWKGPQDPGAEISYLLFLNWSSSNLAWAPYSSLILKFNLCIFSYS